MTYFRFEYSGGIKDGKTEISKIKLSDTCPGKVYRNSFDWFVGTGDEARPERKFQYVKPKNWLGRVDHEYRLIGHRNGTKLYKFNKEVLTRRCLGIVNGKKCNCRTRYVNYYCSKCKSGSFTRSNSLTQDKIRQRYTGRIILEKNGVPQEIIDKVGIHKFGDKIFVIESGILVNEAERVSRFNRFRLDKQLDFKYEIYEFMKVSRCLWHNGIRYEHAKTHIQGKST